MAKTPQHILNQIQAADPDGHPVDPTEADYKAHEAWARKAFGNAAWAEYKGSNWGEIEDDFEAGGLRRYYA